MIKKTLLILGAKSDIGLKTAYRFAREGYDIQLAARNVEEILPDSSDLSIRYGVNVSIHEFDALDFLSHEQFVNNLPTLPTVALSCIGLLGIQSDSEININKAIKVIRTNFEGVVSILGVIANKFKRRGYGTIIGISSVAGDRGRGSNFIYTLLTETKKKLSVILDSHHIHQHKLHDKFGIKRPIHIEHIVCF